MPDIIRIANISYDSTGEVYFTKDELNNVPKALFESLGKIENLSYMVLRDGSVIHLVGENSPQAGQARMHILRIETVAGNRVVVTGTVWDDKGEDYIQSGSILYFLTANADIVLPKESEWEMNTY